MYTVGLPQKWILKNLEKNRPDPFGLYFSRFSRIEKGFERRVETVDRQVVFDRDRLVEYLLVFLSFSNSQ